MRLVIPSVAALMLLVATSTDAPSQGLGPILGPVVGPVDSLLRRGVRRALRPYVYRPRVYRPRARSVRSPAASRRAVAQSPQRQIAQGEVAQPQPFWPDAPQDVFDFVLLSEGAGLWAHGYGAMIVSMFAQSTIPAEARGGAQLAASDTTGQAAGVAPSGDDEMVCGERDIVRAEETIKDLSAELAFADDQRPVLAELRSALRRAEEEMIAACPYSIPATLPERLRTMQDRLWAMRVTVTNLRAPLQKFHDALTNEQKTKLDGPPPRRDSKRDETAIQCHASAQAAPQWPADEIARALRPNNDQQAALETLSKTSSQMGLLMMGSCPQKIPATPLARLNSTLDWLDAMLFAGVNMAAEVDNFYRGLNEQQKAKLDKIDL